MGIPAIQLPRGTLDDRAGELAMINTYVMSDNNCVENESTFKV